MDSVIGSWDDDEDEGGNMMSDRWAWDSLVERVVAEDDNVELDVEEDEDDDDELVDVVVVRAVENVDDDDDDDWTLFEERSP